MTVPLELRLKGLLKGINYFLLFKIDFKSYINVYHCYSPT